MCHDPTGSMPARACSAPPRVVDGRVTAMDIPVHQGIRTKETEYTELGLSGDTPEEELLEAVVAHPRLLERPIVVTEKGARIARPSINVIDEIL